MDKYLKQEYDSGADSASTSTNNINNDDHNIEFKIKKGQ